MNGKRAKKYRRQVGRDNKEVFTAFMLEISAQPFWQRFVFCMRMAFKRHNLQKSMKTQIAERKKMLKAQKIATGDSRNIPFQIAWGFLIGVIILAGTWFMIAAGG